MKNTLKILFTVLLSCIIITEAQAQVPAPTPTAPTSGSTGISLTPDMQWTTTLGPLARFRVQVSTDQAFATTALDVQNISGTTYTIPASTLQPNTLYYWRVNQAIVLPIGGLTTSPYSAVNNFRTAILTGLEPLSNVAPGEYKLYNNYPNPFNPSTKIKFDIKEAGFTELSVYSITGEQVALVASGSLKAGTYEAEWNAGALTSGVYFYRLTSGTYYETKRLMLVK